jgi:hypothetical protein
MNTKPRVLFVGLNIRFMNATSSLWISVLGKIFNVHCYGPGFVDSKTLSGGVEKYVDSIGGVDFIFATHYHCFDMTVERINLFITKFTARATESTLVTPKFMDDTKSFLRRNKIRVCCILTEVDPHVLPQSELDECIRHADYFVLWGKGFLNAKGDMAAVAEEYYIQMKLAKGFKLGSLDDFAYANSSNIINLGHHVSDNEFYWGALSTRKYDVSVPGTRYYRRQKFIDELKSSPVSVNMAELRYRFIYKVADRLSLRAYANFYTLHLYNLAFQQVLSQSKICITDGGANNFPVRKFFEIPAAGALMVCWPAEGLELLGFKHKVNCFFVREAEEAIKIVQEAYRNPNEFQHIAAAGQDLVLMNHSTTARALQLGEAFRRIQSGSFNGSSWQDGRFICLPK